MFLIVFQFCCSEVSVALKTHERQLGGVEDQQRRMLDAVRREARTLETKKRSLQRQLEMERARLAAVVERIRQIGGGEGVVQEEVASSARSSRGVAQIAEAGIDLVS